MVSTSDMQLPRWQRLRLQIGEWIEAPRQQAFIVILIIINAITLGLRTVPEAQAHFGLALSAIDYAIIAIFVVEIACKLLHRGAGFFTSGWNVFDFVIISISLFPASGVFSVLRTMRILRALRLVNKMKQLRYIVEAMLRALPGLGWVAVLIFILLYIFDVLGTTLFGNTHPHLFGNLASTTYTLFELMTLEGWTVTAREVMTTHPYAYLFFIPFILLASYILLNLVIGIIISSMDSLDCLKCGSTEADAATPADGTSVLLEELRRLHEKIDRMEQRLASLPHEQESAAVK